MPDFVEWHEFGYDRKVPMKKIFNIVVFVVGLVAGIITGAALLAYAYQEAGLYPPDDATVKFMARERGWLRDEVE
jgi:hypothetical protein